MLKKVLIANRGEIACRIIRACKKLDIEAVAIYSTPDEHAPHVQQANEAYHVGEGPATQSYLNQQKILEIADMARCDAIHPGYGFLAENFHFARNCRVAGITFIGPSAESMEMMGNKVHARRLVRDAGVPMVPGSENIEHGYEEALALAEQIGFPVILKAASGGGGIGMTIARDAQQLEAGFNTSTSLARSAFGDASVYMEKYLERPSHVEIQVFGDVHGNYIHLFERECSIQRRHQKIIEESPSQLINDEIRAAMGAAAVAAAASVNYTNAGTVEFLVDEQKNFYFLEMNTRLQVEHPVTEMVTGVDMVELQLRIASGEPITISQEEVVQHGASIECRIYAEDPDNNFMPSPGKIERLVEPQREHIRIDSGIHRGFTVPMYYDPLLAKLIVWGDRRLRAIERMSYALRSYEIGGIKTNIPLLRKIITNEHFVAGNIDTTFIQTRLAEEQAVAS